MYLFYTPYQENSSPGIFLNEEESKHCVKVLRLQAGDKINLIDGRGGFYDAEILSPHPKKTEIKILNSKLGFGKRSHYLHIAIAPTKNIERTEWFLEKATEIGIDEITPLICERSERKEIKLDRLNKVIEAAMKQSIKAYHPRLNDVVKLKDFLSADFTGQKFIAHCIPSEKTVLKNVLKLYNSYLVLIGPEGDFNPAEVDMAIKEGFLPISLGESRLRTETAALAACFEIKYLNQ